MPATRPEVLDHLAALLSDARETGRRLEGLPPELLPTDMAEVYAVQDRLARHFGPVGGWKIGASSPEAEPVFAPMPEAWMLPNESALRGPHWRYRGLEAEVAFLVGQDLPPRAEPYTREEVLAAMRSCHPAIEVLESAFEHPEQLMREAMLADMQLHGGFVPGPACPEWQTVNFAKERVELVVDGFVRVDRGGSNTAGDLLRLLPYLANQGAARTGGLRAGQWITTGSWTGSTRADTTSTASAEFGTLGRVDLRFA